MVLERRMAYHDPRHGWAIEHDGSLRARVVRNPQQVVVTEVDRPEFYNSATDFEPSRVDPRWGILHTQPAVLRPDPMWMYRWPSRGPYAGRTPAPFAWEAKQREGSGLQEITAEQRAIYARLTERIASLESRISRLRNSLEDLDRLGRLSLIEGQLDQARDLLESSGELQDEELDMAMDDTSSMLDQVEERLDEIGRSSTRTSTRGRMGMSVVLLGAAALGTWLWMRSRNTGEEPR